MISLTKWAPLQLITISPLSLNHTFQREIICEMLENEAIRQSHPLLCGGQDQEVVWDLLVPKTWTDSLVGTGYLHGLIVEAQD
jgi:hypothetical protein